MLSNIVIQFQTKLSKLYGGAFSCIEFTLLRTIKLPRRNWLIFNRKSLEIPRNHLIYFGKIKRLSLLWSYVMVLNTEPLDCESSAGNGGVTSHTSYLDCVLVTLYFKVLWKLLNDDFLEYLKKWSIHISIFVSVYIYL